MHLLNLFNMFASIVTGFRWIIGIWVVFGFVFNAWTISIAMFRVGCRFILNNRFTVATRMFSTIRATTSMCTFHFNFCSMSLISQSRSIDSAGRWSVSISRDFLSFNLQWTRQITVDSFSLAVGLIAFVVVFCGMRSLCRRSLDGLFPFIN